MRTSRNIPDKFLLGFIHFDLSTPIRGLKSREKRATYKGLANDGAIIPSYVRIPLLSRR